MTDHPVFQPGTLLVEPTYDVLHIETTQQAVEIAEAIQAAKIAGKIDSGSSNMTDLPDGTLGWIVQITVHGELYTAYQGDWLVKDAESGLSTWHGNSPADWKGINPEFADKYSTNTPIIWAATATPPLAIAGEGGTAKLWFPQPVSANRPFTYPAVSQHDMTEDTAGPAALEGDPVIDAAGNVTLTVTGLVDGHEYSWAVDVDTQYEGVSATSLSTLPVAFATPEPD
jgi:hypothetical protein